MTSAEVLSVGAELLLGETVDSNAAFLAAEMATLGLPLASVRMLPDDREVVSTAFVEARSRSSVILATGGLGPTHDDLTREGLADALGEELHEDPRLVAELEDRFRAFGPMPAANRRQALLVRSAESLPNPIGSAPGWWVERDGAIVVLMPGVPSEMRLMWTEQVRPRLAARLNLPPLAVRTVKAFGIGESAMAERLGSLITSPPAGVDVGIYARDDGVHVRFSTRDEASVLDACAVQAQATLGEDVYGTDEDDLATVALVRLATLGVASLATWEAGTDGTLLSILAAARPRSAAATFVGGVLDVAMTSGPPVADAVLQVSLLPQDAGGRSRVRVSLSGSAVLPTTERRIHGSGPQRLRRAAFAALDAVRRISSSDR